MGRTAGHNMTGSSKHYRQLPFFYSDLFDLGYEAVGEIDSRLEIVEDWDEKFREGLIDHLKDGYVRGVLLWNKFGLVGCRTRVDHVAAADKDADLVGQLRRIRVDTI